MTSLKGSFLVAEPGLLDPNFRRSVVLILEHGAAGAYGVVVNRPVAAEGLPLPVHNGGPCPSPGLVMLHAHREWLGQAPAPEERTPAEPEITAGIFVGNAACLERAAQPVPGETFRFRLFRNYSGWGPEQLEQELAAGAWTTVAATAELLFDVPADELWLRLRPRSLPEPSLN
jgi:putative transcriptional regulator